jgi:singapore isolate B (sub-type 7) whole genome shotgun sequence assembly, scaffold_0
MNGGYEYIEMIFIVYRTIVAIAGKDYVVLGGDTRLTQGYEILSRNVSRVHELTQKCVLGSGGCWTDMVTLNRLLDLDIKELLLIMKLIY